MQVTFFQRKRRNSSYSLEFIFEDLRNRLRECIDSKVKVAPFFSNGFFRRLGIMISAKFSEGEINHVTGDNNFVGLVLRKNRTVVSILDCGDYDSRRGIKGWLLRKIWVSWPANRCAVVTTISETSRQAILKISGCNPDKVVVIPVAVSGEFRYTPKSRMPESPRILQVGASPNKNLERVIEAIREIDCTYVVVGKLTSAQRACLESARIKYENFVGLSVEELVTQYEAADILVFASTFEGFGMPIVEAQIVGRPVVTSNLSSMPEVAGRGACLVDPLSVADIRSGIERVIEDSEYRQMLVDEGVKNAQRFDAAQIADQYHAVYLSVRAEA